MRKSLNFNDYVNCLTDFIPGDGNKDDNVTVPTYYRTMTSIRSYGHRLYTIEQKKTALTRLDDKWFIIISEGVQTYAWGHYKIGAVNGLILQLKSANADAPDDEDVDEDV